MATDCSLLIMHLSRMKMDCERVFWTSLTASNCSIQREFVHHLNGAASTLDLDCRRQVLLLHGLDKKHPGPDDGRVDPAHLRREQHALARGEDVPFRDPRGRDGQRYRRVLGLEAPGG